MRAVQGWDRVLTRTEATGDGTTGDPRLERGHSSSPLTTAVPLTMVITRSLRLEKTFRIIKSNLCLIPSLSPAQSTRCHVQSFLGGLQTSLPAPELPFHGETPPDLVNLPRKALPTLGGSTARAHHTTGHVPAREGREFSCSPAGCSLPKAWPGHATAITVTKDDHSHQNIPKLPSSITDSQAASVFPSIPGQEEEEKGRVSLAPARGSS